ncbi:beta-N-acetylhexosaminidase [Paenibacillus puldeungensis]|uniref:Beta-N-acetylhexosaminidase n=1 Tax=Paenibacillus puldeungensis TaxID=696536 RepID=A0ABW3RSV3_9BACL
MDVCLKGISEELKQGVNELAGILNLQVQDGGLPVEVVQEAGPLMVSLQDGKGMICYEKKIHFFRGLGLFAEHAAEADSFTITEQPQFDYNGTMLDASRNAVMKVDAIKQFLRYMAVMGLNGLMMYTEDTYEIKDLPYFGYMRGRYTEEELRECDDYADMFGIEIIPCIQTLGHLFQALKWSYAGAYRDQADILLCGDPDTYRFIEQMITAASAPLRSKRIHIGMDEAFQVGLGTYLRKHGFHDRFEIMNEHVRQVMEITSKLGLKPMIWSDMYFNLLANANQGSIYDMGADFSQENMSKIPEGVQFVYWDYYRIEEEGYEAVFEKHKQLGSLPLFAGGVHMWNSLAPNYGKTWATSHPGLRAAKKTGLKEVFATAWGDDGNETNHFVILAGLQLFAEYGYRDEVTDEHVRTRLKACTGVDLLDPLIALKRMDEVPGVKEDNFFSANPCKFLLWQDLLIGLFDKHIEGMENVLPDYYAGLEKEWHSYKLQLQEPFAMLFDFYEKLAAVLKIKSTLGLTIKKHYDAKVMSELRSIAENVLPDLYQKVDELRLSHRKSWMMAYKPFGWEVLDLRYGGVMARIKSVRDRLLDYVDGRVDRLEELDEERLLFTQNGTSSSPMDVNAHFHQIATTGYYYKMG